MVSLLRHNQTHTQIHTHIHTGPLFVYKCMCKVKLSSFFTPIDCGNCELQRKVNSELKNRANPEALGFLQQRFEAQSVRQVLCLCELLFLFSFLFFCSFCFSSSSSSPLSSSFHTESIFVHPHHTHSLCVSFSLFVCVFFKLDRDTRNGRTLLSQKTHSTGCPKEQDEVKYSLHQHVDVIHIHLLPCTFYF